MSNLRFPPGALAIDPSSGDLWLLGLASDGRTKELLRYSSSDGTLHRRTVPTSAGLYSAMAVDSRGHVILAQGGFVLDVDPAGGYVEYEPTPGGYFTDIALSDNDKAYVSKEYVATIIEIDLRTGEITEHALPESMSMVQHIALAGHRLWMTAPISTEELPARSAVLDLETGQTEVIPLKPSALAAHGQSRMFATREVPPAVVALDAWDASIESGPWTFTREHDGLPWDPRLLAVDEERGKIWAAGGGSGIVSIEPEAGKQEYYPLPSAAETLPASMPLPWYLSNCPTPREEGCPPRYPSFTSVEGIAVAPNGDLYFADATFNRIGVVHPR